jgi:predicted GNAT family N-acyltransferase
MAEYEITIAETDAEREVCFAIRKEVFVEEQTVPLELEMDEYDADAVHFLLRDQDGAALGTARLLGKDGAAKIGRVAVIKAARGRGLGRELMCAVMETARLRGDREAVLDSQTYAIPFYALLGFTVEDEEFYDAGILHRRMRLVL